MSDLAVCFCIADCDLMPCMAPCKVTLMSKAKEMQFKKHKVIFKTLKELLKHFIFYND
jgi:hypothetical protein